MAKVIANSFREKILPLMLRKRKNNDSHTHQNFFLFSVHKINGPVPWPFYGVSTANYNGSHQKFCPQIWKQKSTSQ